MQAPNHVAIIMDGNGRWAKSKGFPRTVGHAKGAQNLEDMLYIADELGIKYLTVYAFSTENWKRTMEEVSGIFKLLVKFVKLDLSELDEENVKVRVIGDYSVIPDAARKSLDKTLETTKDNTGMQFNVAINYGSRAEIVRGVNSIVDRVRSGEIDGEITEEKWGRLPETGMIALDTGCVFGNRLTGMVIEEDSFKVESVPSTIFSGRSH